MRPFSLKCRLLLCQIVLSCPCAYAEVNKCVLSTGQVVYQSTPCPAATVDQQEITIQPINPELQAEALADLKETQQELQAADKAAEAQANQERRAYAKAKRAYAKRGKQEAKRNSRQNRGQGKSSGSSGKRVFTQRIPFIK